MIKDLKCVFRAEDSHNIHLYLVSKKPCRRTIAADILYNLPFPYIHFAFYVVEVENRYYLSHLTVCFSNSDFDLHKECHFATLPNMNYFGVICLGDDNILGDSAESVIEKTIDKFWNTRFRTAIGGEPWFYYTRHNYFKHSVNNFEEWSRLTTKDILTMSFPVLKDAKSIYKKLSLEHWNETHE